MRSRIFKVSLWLTTALGAFAGYRLAELPNLQPYKLLNIVGLLYSLLAIFVLSEVLVSSADWKRICVEWIAPTLLWANVTVPIGVFVGAGFAWLLKRGPSASTLCAFGVSAFWYMSLVGQVLDEAVVFPRLFKRDIESRWRYFGLVLLATGLLLQVISAILGL